MLVIIVKNVIISAKFVLTFCVCLDMSIHQMAAQGELVILQQEIMEGNICVLCELCFV